VFDAAFTGTSNPVRGRAPAGGVPRDDRLLPGHGAGAAVAGDAVLIVRPEDMRLVDAAAAVVSGVDIDTQFFGGVSTVAIAVAGHDSPLLHTRPGAPQTERGAEVHLAWDAARAIVLAG
jgi:spermidine/putrescine transport system ATP-binding protein/putrescine transport system ATP-binding protein